MSTSNKKPVEKGEEYWSFVDSLLDNFDDTKPAAPRPRTPLTDEERAAARAEREARRTPKVSSAEAAAAVAEATAPVAEPTEVYGVTAETVVAETTTKASTATEAEAKSSGEAPAAGGYFLPRTNAIKAEQARTGKKHGKLRLSEEYDSILQQKEAAPAVEEVPVVETPVVEAPVVEVSAVEEPVVEAPVVEAPEVPIEDGNTVVEETIIVEGRPEDTKETFETETTVVEETFYEDGKAVETDTAVQEEEVLYEPDVEAVEEEVAEELPTWAAPQAPADENVYFKPRKNKADRPAPVPSEPEVPAEPEVPVEPEVPSEPTISFEPEVTVTEEDAIVIEAPADDLVAEPVPPEGPTKEELKEQRKAEKQAAKELKAAEKAAAKEAKEAEKQAKAAEKAAAKEAKEAEKQAKAAEKEAAKELKAAEKAAEQSVEEAFWETATAEQAPLEEVLGDAPKSPDAPVVKAASPDTPVIHEEKTTLAAAPVAATAAAHFDPEARNEEFDATFVDPNKRGGALRVIRNIIITLAILAIVTCCALLVYNFAEEKLNARQFTQASALLAEGEQQNDLTKVEKEHPDIAFPEDMSPAFGELYAENQDLVGWVSLDGTDFSYPVVQTKDDSFYQNHNFTKASSPLGTPFLSTKNDASDLDLNNVIYGQNAQKDPRVFGTLENYRSSDYFRKHPVLEYRTLSDTYRFKVYGVFVTNSAPEQDNGYVFDYTVPNLGTVESFAGYVDQINQRRFYDTGVDIESSDKLLTLSTSTDDFDGARLVVVGRLLREDESEKVDETLVKKNKAPRYPQVWYDQNGQQNPYDSTDNWIPTIS